jgi:plastocyanin
MYVHWKTGRARSYLFSFVLLFLSCSPVREKTEPKVHTIEIKQMKFQPSELTVQKGDTVIWINQDIVAHDVTEASAKAWTSSVLTTGQSWKMVAVQSVNYYCSIHVIMKGKFIVE